MRTEQTTGLTQIHLRYRLVPQSPQKERTPLSEEPENMSMDRLFCGSGVGRRGVDLTFVKDGHGRPYIPGSTLKGNLRDKCTDLCRAMGLSLTRHHEGKFTHLYYQTWLNAIFGVPAQEEIHAVFSDVKLTSSNHAESVRKRIQIDRRLGRPRHQSLFDTVYALRETMEGEIWCWRTLNKDSQDPALALLLGGLCMLSYIGGHRSTGAGSIVAQVQTIGLDPDPYELNNKGSLREQMAFLMAPLASETTDIWEAQRQKS
ncbi:RAMP superfamily CRISPR-associated protein [Myxococcota bacterium]|nr:RAMP superfamily CRISPR-associated protein [Myxococcota bacterium]